MVIQCFVDAGNGFYLLQYSADVVTDKDNGAFFIDFSQQFIKACFETLVDIRAGFVENQHLRVGDDGTAQQGTLQLSAAKCRWHAVPCLPAPCGLSSVRLSRGVGR